MKKSPPASTTPVVSRLNIKRRHQVAATAAALSLAGCGMFSQPAAAPSSPERQEAERKVKAYQTDIESALDKVDQDRLRAAAQKNSVQVIAATTTSPTQVILASAAGAEPTGAVAPVGAAKSGGATAASAAAPVTSAAGTAALPVTPTMVPAPDAGKRLATPGAIATSAPAAGMAAGAPTATTIAATEPSAAPASASGATTVSPTASTSPELTTLAVPPTAGGVSSVVAAPLSGDAAVSSAVIAPFTPPATPGASAMGTMSAVAAPNLAVTADSPAAPAAPAEITADQAVEALRKNVGEHPTLNTALALALLDGGKPDDAIKKLSDTDQKLATDLLAALDAMQSRTNAPTLADRAAPLMDAAQSWRDTADLTLPRLVLASRVDSFGVFTPITGNFEQGKRHTVIIYCEVANFRSVKGDDGWYTTKLSQQETLFTEDNLLVWRPNAEDVEDRSLNQRHDFYLVKKLTLPETLAAGKYTLRMSVTDRTANKIKIVEMPLEIVAKDAPSASPSVTSAAK